MAIDDDKPFTVDRYLELLAEQSPDIPIPAVFKPSDALLHWWKFFGSENHERISYLARKYLSGLATEANVERCFSLAKRITSPLRNSLHPENMEGLIFLHSHTERLKQEIAFPLLLASDSEAKKRWKSPPGRATSANRARHVALLRPLGALVSKCLLDPLHMPELFSRNGPLADDSFSFSDWLSSQGKEIAKEKGSLQGKRSRKDVSSEQKESDSLEALVVEEDDDDEESEYGELYEE